MALQKFLPGQLVVWNYNGMAKAFFIVGEPEFGLTQDFYFSGNNWYPESQLTAL